MNQINQFYFERWSKLTHYTKNGKKKKNRRRCKLAISEMHLDPHIAPYTNTNPEWCSTPKYKIWNYKMTRRKHHRKILENFSK